MTRRTNQYFLFVFLYFLLCSELLAPWMARFLPFSSIWVNILFQFIVFLPLIGIYLKTERVPFRECLALRPIHWKNALLSIGITYCALPFVSMIVILTSPLQPNLAEESMQALSSSGSFPALLLFIAVQPAIFEECLFRGVTLHGYRSLGRWRALLVSAFLFGMLHMNLQQALYAFALGALFAFLVQRTGSILASMLPHFFINAINCAASYFAPPQMGIVAEPSWLQQMFFSGLQCLIFLPFLAGLLFWFVRRNPLPSESLPVSCRQEKIITLSLIFIILIFILFGVLPNLYAF